MSQTRGVVRLRIYEAIGDMNPNERAIAIPRMNEIIARNYHRMLYKTIQFQPLSTSISVSSGTYDYSVDSSNEVLEVGQVFDSTNNRELIYKPFQELNSLYRFDTDNPTTGLPVHWSTFEISSQTMRLRLGPKPNAALTVKIYRSVIQSLLTSDGSNISFGDGLIRGLEAACIADAILAESEKLGIPRSAASDYRLQEREAIREHNLVESHTGRRQNQVTRVG